MLVQEEPDPLFGRLVCLRTYHDFLEMALQRRLRDLEVLHDGSPFWSLPSPLPPH